MQILFILPSALNKADQNLLNEQQYADLVNLGHQYFIELSDSRVPTLFFRDKSHQDAFFNKFKIKNEPHLLFTLIEHKKASSFYGRLFYNLNRTKAIKSEEIANAPELAVFSNRAIRFKLDEQTIIRISQDTKTELGNDNHPNSYFECLIREVNQDEYYFYSNFFLKRKGPPLAFPLSGVFGANNYFSPDLVVKRKKLLTTSFCNAIKDTLFFNLWKLTDEPVFREYLRKGGWFEIKSSFEKSENELFAGEYAKMYLNYYYSETDIVRKWWGELIQLDDKEDNSELGKISMAILNDMTHCIEGLEVGISSTADEKKGNYEWATLNLNYEDDLPILEEGPWKYISDFSNSLIDTELKDFLEEKILINSSEKLPEHGKVLHLLAQYLCKCPLENFSNDNDQFDLSNTWNLMLTFFIKSHKCKTMADLIIEFKKDFPNLIFEYNTINKSCTYSYLTKRQKLQLQLLLPPDTKLVAEASNVLDNANAVLDLNFVL